MRATWCGKKGKRGLANVIGMLLMVGVLFSAVLPLFLYVNQVNSYYDNTVEEMTFEDQQKASETLEVFAYPLGENFTLMNVKITNTGVIPVKVVRIWITELNNHTSEYWDKIDIPDLENEIPPSTQMTIHNVSIASFGVDDRLLSVKLSSERGKLFASESNPIWISEGGWSGSYSQPYNIQFVFSSPKGQGTWKIEGEIRVWYNQTIDDENLNVTYHNAVEIDQLVQGVVYLESIGVPYEGRYHVVVDLTTPQGNGIVYDDTVLITSYNPLRWIYIPLN